MRTVVAASRGVECARLQARRGRGSHLSAARENRVGGRNSRTSSHAARGSMSPGRQRPSPRRRRRRAWLSRPPPGRPRVASCRRREGAAGSTQPRSGRRGAPRVAQRAPSPRRCRGGRHGRRAACGVVEHERRLGLRRARARSRSLPRPRARRRAAAWPRRGARLAADEGGESGRCAARYCAIFTLRRAAAWVTWPATATARSCAARPRTSACARREPLAGLLLGPQVGHEGARARRADAASVSPACGRQCAIAGLMPA